jgi:hypothetical protein
MPDRDLISATIAAALIQSGQFKLEWFDADGKPLERQNEFTSRTECERFITQAEVLGRPGFDWRTSPALSALRKLTDAIRHALYDTMSAPSVHPT